MGACRHCAGKVDDPTGVKGESLAFTCGANPSYGGQPVCLLVRFLPCFIIHCNKLTRRGARRSINVAASNILT